jgi:hypothetical protein
MSVQELHNLVGTALTDEGFKEDLFGKPQLVISRFDLREEEELLVYQALGLSCFYAGDPLMGFARVLANAKLVREDPITVSVGGNLEPFPPLVF